MARKDRTCSRRARRAHSRRAAPVLEGAAHRRDSHGRQRRSRWLMRLPASRWMRWWAWPPCARSPPGRQKPRHERSGRERARHAGIGLDGASMQVSAGQGGLQDAAATHCAAFAYTERVSADACRVGKPTLPDLYALIGCAVHGVAGFDAESSMKLRQIGKYAFHAIGTR